MNWKKSLFLGLLIAFLMGLASGCSTLKGYGKLGFTGTTKPKMTLDQLVENWKDYDIYYSGINEDYVFGIMFDPKNDARKLVGHKWWEPVESQEQLRQSILWMNIFKSFRYEPILWEILSPDNKLHGFIYTARYPMIIKVIDNQTLWVDELTFPPLFEVRLRDETETPYNVP
jgi:hypothetical protein